MLNFKIEKSKKYLFIAGVFILLLGGVYRVWPYLGEIWWTDQEIVLKERRLEKYRQIVHEGDGLEARLVFLKKDLKQRESRLLTGKTPSLAAADIQQILHNMAKETKVDINTVRVLQPEEVDQGRYLSIPVQLNITCTIRYLKEFLYRIKTSPKYLTVKRVGIRAFRQHNNTVNADITILGFLKR
jgi:hypothetical protein